MLLTRVLLPLALFCALSPASGRDSPEVEWAEAYRGNYRRGRSRPIQRVIIHTVEGSVSSAIGTFRNRKQGRRVVSAHYIVGHDGRITQMVKDEDTAYHIRGYNGTSIGIEHEGWADRNNWTAEQYRASARLTRWLCDTYSIPIDREHIRGHGEMPKQRWRHDPGRFFDWDLYLRLIHDLAPVKILSPAEGETLGRARVDPEATLRWLASPDQTHYRVEVEDLDTGERHDSGRQASTADRHTLLFNFRDGSRYRWRVHTTHGDHERRSEWTSFDIDLTPPVLVVRGPRLGVMVTKPPLIRWRYAKRGAPMAGYRVWVAEGPLGPRVIDTLEFNGPADGYQLPDRLLPSTRYVYRVMVHDGRGNQTLSPWYDFITAPAGFWSPPGDTETFARETTELPDPISPLEPNRGVLDLLGDLDLRLDPERIRQPR